MKGKIEYEALRADSLGEGLSFPVSVLRVVDSTNTEARRRVLEGGESAPFAILAEEQSAGRGRMGRSFYSPEGTGIYLSLCFKASGIDPLSLTTAAAVATHNAIKETTGIVTRIKWVNDLYFRERKVSGILAESFFVGEMRYVILGVGVNLYTTEFPRELAEIAGGLTDAASGLRNRLASALLRELSALMGEHIPEGVMETYRAHSMVLGREIRYTENGIDHEGIATAIDEQGRLSIRCRDGRERILASGEITLRLNNGKGER